MRSPRARTPASVRAELTAKTRRPSTSQPSPFEARSPWDRSRFAFRREATRVLYGPPPFSARTVLVVEQRLGRRPESIAGFAGCPDVVLGPPFAYLCASDDVASELQDLARRVEGVGLPSPPMVRVFRVLESIALDLIDATLVLEIADVADLLGAGRAVRVAKDLLATLDEISHRAPAFEQVTSAVIESLMRLEIEVPPALQSRWKKVRRQLRAKAVLVHEGRAYKPMDVSRWPELTFVCATMFAELQAAGRRRNKLDSTPEPNRQQIFSWIERFLELYLAGPRSPSGESLFKIFGRRPAHDDDEPKSGEIVRRLLERKRLRTLMKRQRHALRIRSLWTSLYPADELKEP